MIKLMTPKSGNVKHEEINSNLEKLLVALKAKRPLFEFEPTRYKKQLKVAGELMLVLVGVEVWMKGVCLGSIRADHERLDKDGNKCFWYALESNTIKKDRGPRNQKVAKDMKKALTVALEHFVFPESNVLGKNLITNGRERLGSLVEDLSYRTRSGIRIDTMQVAVYFLELARGANPLPPPKLQSFDEEAYQRYDMYLVGSDIGKQFLANQAYVVQEMKDGSFACAKSTEENSYRRYENVLEMPEFMQEKLTMLKLIDKDSPLAHVGVRIEYGEISLYVITEGSSAMN
jgi:hypothetical protein